MDVIKGKIKKFRSRELKELLNFSGLDSVGCKAILLDRAIRMVENNSYLNNELKEEFDEKINELFECTKIPLWKLLMKYAPPLENFPMYVDAKTMIPGQRFDLERGEQTIEFTLTSHSIYLLTNGKREDGTIKFEVSLTVWNCNTDEDWEDISLCVDINDMPLDILHPGPHIFYLTSLCVIRESVCNRITISSPRPEILSNYAFNISIVRRLLPTELISVKTPENVYNNTKHLVADYFKKNTYRRYILSLICPIRNQVITNPCRSSLCTHPEVFDLLTFLDDMQCCLQWKCPVCMKRITYDDLLLDKYLKTYSESGKTAFVFYKAREPIFNCENDDDMICEEEIIIID